ncbi:DUF4124 domain-containing protein [Wenzhouxiangella sp. AB-CW3]|uniref:DUF4124 domain-containing protein n=1 Tax=Wenzhouxiangella sp. AB-CW3 TaxID=2771012 RepID=UPI00168B5CCC|nr:DUF4124 domain-containing protein [Wenzhouxiangella sp. AB-CW3]QOC21138.1 DUF4124 domain-containing protein [Wenzhouxiangella sp. AB-CW3]
MTRHGVLIALSTLLIASAANAEIYRCERDSQVVFSDQPCADQVEVHQPTSTISVIAPAGDLDQVAERNRAFIESRQAQRLALQQARLEQRRQAAAEPSQRTSEANRVLYVPERHLRRGPGPVRDRRAARRDAPGEREIRERQARPFSALSGPFPGTQRDGRRSRVRD